MQKIITFLGRRPLETRYEFAGQVYVGRVFAEALRQFVTYDQMLVCVTDEARSDAWPVLESLGDPRIVDVPIPRGETTEEIWQIFSNITSQVEPNETVIFDITHGLRSLPFLVFLFAAYLQSAKQVKIGAIYYGALELGDPKTGKPAPVINLSEFVKMLDWLTASDQFARFGDSTDLAELVRQTGAYPDKHPMTQAVQTMDLLSQSLRLIRPLDAMRTSAMLPDVLEAARPAAQEIPPARPYTLLVEDLKKVYAPFASKDPLDTSEGRFEISLAKQRDLIAWYVKHQQWVQAVSLAREWLVTWVMWQMGETEFLNQPLRETVADTMSKEAQRYKDAKEQKISFHPLFLRSVPDIASILGDWLSLAGVRNDIDHAGMRKNSRPAPELIKSVTTLCKKLDRLPVQQANKT